MGYTKREFIAAAYAEIGYANYQFDLQAEDLQLALRRLDAMMAEWNARGIRLGYPLPSSPSDSNLDDPTGVPDRANEAIILNLAPRLAPGVGKAIHAQTLASAKAALNTLLAVAAMPAEMQLAALPRGAGAKSIDQPFSAPTTDPLAVGPDSYLSLD
jgi:hypothetical protein